MKKITDIKPQIKNPTRCNIYLDNVFYCGLELETVMKNRLKAGMEIEESRLDEIQAESETVRAFEKALGFISRSKKTEKQIKTYLAGKGYTDGTIENVLEKLRAYDFANDLSFAEDFVAAYSATEGKRLIEMKLRQKGVSEADAKKAVEKIEDESETAYRVAEKYLRNKSVDKSIIAKCYKHLLSKGFDYDTAKEAAKRAAEEKGADDEDDNI